MESAKERWGGFMLFFSICLMIMMMTTSFVIEIVMMMFFLFSFFFHFYDLMWMGGFYDDVDCMVLCGNTAPRHWLVILRMPFFVTLGHNLLPVFNYYNILQVRGFVRRGRLGVFMQMRVVRGSLGVGGFPVGCPLLRVCIQI